MSNAEAQRRRENKPTKRRNEMGKMGYGYGSEFHLLRWMGRHRFRFDMSVCKTLDVDEIKWLDFKFSKSNDIPDNELRGLDFMDRNNPSFEEVMSHYRESWPQRGNQMNWDAVGIADDMYVLCEAKAHIEEVEREHRLDDETESVQKRADAFDFAKEVIGVQKSIDWLHNYYQMANRLYILALLTHHNIRAMLLNIYFCGDKFRNRVCPKDRNGWRDTINDEYNALGIKNNSFVKERVRHIFLPVDNDEGIEIGMDLI